MQVGEPVGRLWAALGKRDWGAFSAELDPEIEYSPREEQVVYRGPDAVARYTERWLGLHRIGEYNDRAEAREAAGLSKSRDSLDAVREALDALNRGDVPAFAECLHPAVEWEESADTFAGLKGAYHGREEVQRWAQQPVADFWSELSMEVEELTAASEGRVLLGILISARGAASGVDTERRAWQVFWVVDGQIAKRHDPYWSRDQALEAAGLQP